ncbi:TatD family hydrolase [Spirochaeta cellobiosiphila]|uniref:TatD family hydrolase n=1 Tax=Spirochaeta cellobiosiphila TaxID=504483 RepID=UPI00040BC7C7|nr:TatD family hydrolase [Spirochaeta cellobiosiphila]
MNNTYKLIDTHFHMMEMLRKEISPHDIFTQSQDIAFLMDIAVDGDNFDQRTNITHSSLYYSAGIHPENTNIDIDKHKNLVLEQVEHPRVIAIGETGIDLHYTKDTLPIQLDLLHFQAELAIKKDLPLVIHSRDADKEILQALKPYKGKVQGIFHCFSSGPEFVENSLDLGFYYSFAGNVTFKSARNIQEAARVVPKERIFVETDAPYLTPVPHRGKGNSPLYVHHTLEYVATQREMLPKSLEDQILINIRSLWGNKINLPL